MPQMRRAIIGTFPNDSKTKWPIILQNESSNNPQLWKNIHTKAKGVVKEIYLLDESSAWKILKV